MKLTPTLVLATALLWALVIVALPSNPEASPGFSPLTDSPSDVLLGINCRGSALCSSECNVTIQELKAMVDTLDDNSTFANGQQIACAKCPHCSDSGACAFPRNMGICVFPQKMKKDEKVKGAAVKSAVNALVAHKCKGCGSCPVHGGNDVNAGEITINYVKGGCQSGALCKVADAYVTGPPRAAGSAESSTV